MIASGKKTIEIRSWKTNYRGLLLICSSRTPNIELAGHAIAIVTLYDCLPMRIKDVKGACCKYEKGHYSWHFKDIRKLPEPFPVKGKLGLYTLRLTKTLVIK